MPGVKRPSYLPISAPHIPASLVREQEHWNLDPELVLEPATAREFLRSHTYTTRFLRKTLLAVGFNPDIENKGRLIGHNTRVSLMSLLINDTLQRNGSHLPVDTRILASASIWHDVGKYRQNIHDAIFPSTKRIPQGNDLWKIIKTHPEEGKKIPLTMCNMSAEEQGKIAEAVHFHHERMDGDGYHQKKPSEVPPESFVIAVADTLDVILGRRAYAHHSDLEGAIAELKRCAGTQFHPDVVTAAENAFKTQSGRLVIHERTYLH